MSTKTERRIKAEPHVPAGTVSRRASRPGTPQPLNAAILFAIVALAITVVGLLYLIQTAQVASLGYELTRLERERAAAALANQQLTFAVASYESLPRIEERAIGAHGMQPVSDYRFLVVSLPSGNELPAPPPLERSEDSLAQRVWERLTGRSTATNVGGQP